MSERINVGNTAAAFGGAIQAGVASAAASLRYDRAMSRQAAAMDTLYKHTLATERSRIAAANLRIRLGL